MEIIFFTFALLARMAELVDALVSNTCGKPCRFEPGSGYKKERAQTFSLARLRVL